MSSAHTHSFPISSSWGAHKLTLLIRNDNSKPFKQLSIDCHIANGNIESVSVNCTVNEMKRSHKMPFKSIDIDNSNGQNDKTSFDSGRKNAASYRFIDGTCHVLPTTWNSPSFCNDWQLLFTQRIPQNNIPAETIDFYDSASFCLWNCGVFLLKSVSLACVFFRVVQAARKKTIFTQLIPFNNLWCAHYLCNKTVYRSLFNRSNRFNSCEVIVKWHNLLLYLHNLMHMLAAMEIHLIRTCFFELNF